MSTRESPGLSLGWPSYEGAAYDPSAMAEPIWSWYVHAAIVDSLCSRRPLYVIPVLARCNTTAGLLFQVWL